MHLQSLKISSYCGIRHLDTPISSPVLLVAGPNGSGKSSLQDAIRLVLTAQLGRVSLKKDAAALIRQGAESAECAITADGQQHRVTIARTGKISDSLAGTQEHPALPYVLTPRAFANASADARRVLLTQITGTSASPELIAQRLRERGIDEQRVMLVHGLLAAQSMDTVASHASAKATEARGAWKATTGETYGDKKAAGWKASKPVIDPALQPRLDQELAQIDTNLESAIGQLATAESQLSAARQQATELARLQDAPARQKRIAEKLAIDRAELESWTARLAAAQDELAGITRTPDLLACPCCATQLYLDQGHLHAWQPAKVQSQPRHSAQDVTEYQQSVALYSRAISAGERDLNQVQADLARLEMLTSSATDLGALTANIEALRSRIQRLRAEKASLTKEANEAMHQQQQAQLADKATEEAAAYHQDVQQWAKVAEALSPGGIPAELLASALRPINELLAQFALDTGWMQPALDVDMAITASGRPYALLSESEQWRVDLLLTVAIAHLSGLLLVMVDRFDVLDLPSRGQCIGWLQRLTGAGQLDTVILCGTLKAVPPSNPKLQTIWLARDMQQAPINNAITTNQTVDERTQAYLQRMTRYRNPENPDETWSGRGKRPRWLELALQDGMKLEDFLVDHAQPVVELAQAEGGE